MISRSLRNELLIADCVRPSLAAARVTLRSSINAIKTLNKFNLNPAVDRGLDSPKPL